RGPGDVLILQAKGRRGTAAEPWSGIRQLLDGIGMAPGVSGASPEALAALSPIAPGLQARFPSASARSETVTSRTTALADLLGAVSDESPLLLVLDDATRIDAASVELIVGAVATRSRRIFLLSTLAADDPSA